MSGIQLSLVRQRARRRQAFFFEEKDHLAVDSSEWRRGEAAAWIRLVFSRHPNPPDDTFDWHPFLPRKALSPRRGGSIPISSATQLIGLGVERQICSTGSERRGGGSVIGVVARSLMKACGFSLSAHAVAGGGEKEK